MTITQILHKYFHVSPIFISRWFICKTHKKGNIMLVFICSTVHIVMWQGKSIYIIKWIGNITGKYSVTKIEVSRSYHGDILDALQYNGQ